MRPLPQLFRYYGSKGYLAETLERAIPGGCTTLVSPFVGSGVFEYRYAAKHPGVRVVCFDIDPDVVNFHRVALKRRRVLHATIMDMHEALCRGRGRSTRRHI